MTKKRVARVEEELLSACHLSLVPCHSNRGSRSNIVVRHKIQIVEDLPAHLDLAKLESRFESPTHKGVKSAFCFLLRLLQSSELFAEAASPSPLAPSSANRPSSPTTVSLVQPFCRSLHACDRPIGFSSSTRALSPSLCLTLPMNSWLPNTGFWYRPW